MIASAKRRFRWPVLAALCSFALGASAVVAVQLTREIPGLQQDGSYLVTTNQALTPIGIVRRIESARPKDMALSPDGQLLAVLCTKYVAFFTARGEPLNRVTVRPGPLGIAWAPDGDTVYVSGETGKVLRITKENGVWKHGGEIAVEPPPAPNVRLNGRMRNPQVAGLAVSPDGRTLYAALGIRNAVSLIGLGSDSSIKTIPVGICPYHLLLSPDGKTLFVSNRGGSQGKKREPTAQTAGSDVEIDPETDAANSGSVSFVDTESLRVTELEIGRQPGGMALSADASRLYVAAGDEDAVHIVDTQTRKAVGKVNLALGKTGFGSLPTGCALSDDGATLYAACGGGNSVASIKVGKDRPEGFIPAGWFPICIRQKDGMLIVASSKGIGARPQQPAGGFGVHSSVGTLQFIDLKTLPDLKQLTRQVAENNRLDMPEGSSTRKPAPVPAKLGDPSLFKHVVYIIKENHTYDLDFGDMPEGNGEKSLNVFGEEVTPNAHALARQFVLLDNTYTSGTNSADGHQWVASAIANGYMEQNYDAHERSYPYDGGDALAYSPRGFLWNAAHKKGLSVRIFGEFVNKPRIEPANSDDKATWSALWQDYKSNSGKFKITAQTDNAALRPLLHPNYIGFPTSVCDQWRADQFLAEFKQWEDSGSMPALTMMLLPNNHTVGSRAGYPTPRAMVADNDLALGRIVEAITQSRFWKETLILVIEDDSQMALDHVDGHRTVAQCISPYSRRGSVISEMYNHNSFMKTIELALGIPPMTRFDRTATPLTACFTDLPDFAKFTHLPNRIPLDEMNPPVKALSGTARKLAIASEKTDISREDRADPAVLTRAAWHTMKPTSSFPSQNFHPDGDADDDDE